MLNINNLSISFDNKTILDHISFTLQTGQIACLLGASGCGKTTILRCLAGFETPNTGSIALSDRVLFDDKTNIPPHLRHIGMVFQDYALFPHLTVSENIAFGLGALPKSEQQSRIQELLKLIEMTDYQHSYPHELSGGQQQRVALVRALAPRPSVILLDEPFSNLDVELRGSLSKEVRHLLKSQNVSAILVTHDQAEAFAMADVIGMIADGKLQQWDTPTALYHTPATVNVARFIGEGALIDIRSMDAQSVHCTLGKLPLDHASNPEHTQANKLLVRPHDLRVSDDGISVQVRDRDFRGGYWLYTLSTESNDTLLMQISMAINHASYEIGDKLRVAIRKFSLI